MASEPFIDIALFKINVLVIFAVCLSLLSLLLDERSMDKGGKTRLNVLGHQRSSRVTSSSAHPFIDIAICILDQFVVCFFHVR